MSWESWRLDAPTIAWIAWIGWFLVWETLALFTPVPLDTATAHLRPLFQAHALVWFLTLGLWLWLGYHFLLEGVFVAASGTG